MEEVADAKDKEDVELALSKTNINYKLNSIIAGN